MPQVYSEAKMGGLGTSVARPPRTGTQLPIGDEPLIMGGAVVESEFFLGCTMWRRFAVSYFLPAVATVTVVAAAPTLGLFIACLTPHAGAVAVLAALAAILWVLRMPALPGWGSIWPIFPWPLPTLSVVAMSATLAAVASCLLHHKVLLPALPAAIFAAILSTVFYLLLLPRVLACQHGHRVPSPPTTDDAPSEQAPSAASASPPVPAAKLPPADLGAGTKSPAGAPWEAPIHDQERLRRLQRWLDAGENPIGSAQDDLFDIKWEAARLVSLVKPRGAADPAGTVHLIGARGSGKSTLIRLAAEQAKSQAVDGAIKLRFCYISLWDHADAASAVRAAVIEGIKSIRSRVDIVPFAGAPASLPRALFGHSGAAGILDVIAAPPTEVWLPALSEFLIRVRCRLIFCVEDTDRLAPAEKAAAYFSLLEGFLDSVKRYAGFGYIFCSATPTWSEPAGDQPGLQKKPEASERFNTSYLVNHFGQLSREHKSLSGEVLKDIELSAASARRDYGFRNFWWLTGGVALPRLFQSQIHFDAAMASKCEAVLEVFRAWMDGQTFPRAEASRPYMTGTPGVDPQRRKEAFTAFLNDSTELGVMRYLTPRTLRNGLRDARRRWLSIVRAAKEAKAEGDSEKDLYLHCLDPDSVLVACLILACFPDQAERILRHGIHDWFDTPAATAARQDGYGEGERKSQTTVGRNLRMLSGFSEAVRKAVDYDQTLRPGGLAGPAEQARKNWQVFCSS
ncbi:MAG: hypothetical protein ACP5O1_02790 [Phycisphaerae bacterium]